MTRPLLVAVLPLKNEAAVVRATLDSCVGAVDGVVVILDKSTTDDTEKVVESWAQANGVPVRIEIAEFENYAKQRNIGLEHASDAVFTLSLSADERLEGGVALRQFLEQHIDDEEGAYLITMHTDQRQWPYSRVLRSDAKWRYQGIIHEQPVSPDGVSKPKTIIPGVHVVHKESDPERKLARMREYDLPVLTKHVEDESKSLGDRARGMFFLAETHLFLAHNSPKDENGEHTPAGGAWFSHYMTAMGLYWRHAQIAERESEGVLDTDSAMRAYFMHFYIASKIGLLGPAELEPRLQILIDSAPHLTEPRLLLANCAAQIDPRRGLYFAMEAFKAAEKAEKETDIRYATRDSHVKWSSLALAARCAHALGDDRRAKVYADKAIEFGCPKELFKFEEKRA